MQLLRQLHLLPTPESEEVTAEERKEKLKSVGLYIPEESLNRVNSVMDRIAKSNQKKLQSEREALKQK